ncbi:sel1l adaptor subunit of erad e3 ubiquitin ligase [Anaeramoeba flamelloides]|uniref:Sel1l adaptor subunit of erad e3 ubiquitin ligase n=1 Tax=Anaeramoeba flamelloides TaxID=1746091 RepID=A0ABQ8YY98_9EUKA|nr:sel1l adaptor subunit of erad e3 ubiquitin ligase [Anaeramoeba flamelloides]
MNLDQLKAKARYNPKAQAKLGFFYFQGIEVPQNTKRAVSLFTLSSLKNNSMGNFWLGECYFLGKGVVQDYKTAFHLFNLAAEKKNARAFGRLGDCYFYGHGMKKKNIKKALKLYLKSAEFAVSMSEKRLAKCFNIIEGEDKERVEQEYKQVISEIEYEANELNDPEAQLLLGVLYKNGNGVRKDTSIAFEKFFLSAEQGNGIAKRKLALCYLKDNSRKNLKKSFEWTKLSADKNNPGSLNNLGIRYLNGVEVEKNLEKAIDYFRQAIKLKNSNAYNSLGICYLNGDGVLKDNQIAHKLFLKSHYLGSSNGTESLGYVYECFLEGVRHNSKKAFVYYNEAAKEDNDEGQYSLAFCYLKGVGTEIDQKSAFKLFKKSAKNGNISAKNSYAVCYEKGRGCKKNLKKAFRLYNEAAKEDEPNASYNLGVCYFQGKGCLKNFDKAYDCFNLASKYDEFQELTIIKGLEKIHFVVQNSAPLEEIKSTILEHCDLNKKTARKGDTALHLICKAKKVDEKYKVKLIKLLLDYGANPFIKNKNGKMPIDYIKDEKLKNIFYQTISLSQDFYNYFKHSELYDLKINNIPIHLFWVEQRLGRKINSKLLHLLQSFSSPELNNFFIWVYSGRFEKDRHSIEKIWKLMGYKKYNLTMKSGRLGILKDLQNLKLHNSSKDFVLVVKKMPIKIHKFILQVRSDLFRGMFLNVKQSLNMVKDYSRKSRKTIKLLFHFLYTDNIPMNLINKKDMFFFDEMEDLVDYYQLNENSNFFFCLEKLKNGI